MESAETTENNIPGESSQSLEELMAENDVLRKRQLKMEKDFRAMQSSYDKQVYKEKNGIKENVIPKPAAENFNSTEEYLDALHKWQILHGEVKVADIVKQELQKETLEKEASKRYEKFIKSVNTVKKELSDFDEVTTNDFIRTHFWQRCNNGLPEALHEMGEDGARIAYHLCSNFDKAAEIAKMPSYKIGAELALLYKEIQKTKPKDADIKAPINPVSGKNHAAIGNKTDPYKMSGDEWLAWKRSKAK